MPPFAVTFRDLPALPYDVVEDDKGQVITLRIPTAVHAALKEQAKDQRTSLNSLCLSRVIAPIAQCPIVPCNVRREREQFIAWRNSHLGQLVEAGARQHQAQQRETAAASV